MADSGALDRVRKYAEENGIRYGASYFSRKDAVDFEARWTGDGPVVRIPEFYLGGEGMLAADFRRGVRGECRELACLAERKFGWTVAVGPYKSWTHHSFPILPGMENPMNPQWNPDRWLVADLCFGEYGTLSETGHEFACYGREPETYDLVIMAGVSVPVWSEGGTVYELQRADLDVGEGLWLPHLAVAPWPNGEEHWNDPKEVRRIRRMVRPINRELERLFERNEF